MRLCDSFILPTVALVVWLRLSGVSLVLSTRDGWIAIALGAVTAIYSWALLSSINAIPLALAILVFYLFPLIAAVILGVCGWEKLGWKTIAAIVLAFAGLALALDPRGSNLDIEGVALAIDCGADWLGRLHAIAPTAIMLTTMQRSMVRMKEGTLIGHAPITAQLDWCVKAQVHRARRHQRHSALLIEHEDARLMPGASWPRAKSSDCSASAGWR